ncbi:MAG: hypothetical protein ACI8RN_003140 [Glaciecola sp.]|jgi:hypothetical protein
MLRSNQVPTEIKQIADCSMGLEKPLGLPGRFELPHPSLPGPGRLM